jgi:predicted O-linked N-acetylglucosamine transferase (SPINDLY family)
MNQQTSNPQQILATAIKHHELGELDVAFKIYKQLLAKYPKNTDLLFLIGTVECQKKNFLAGSKYLSKYIKLNKQNPDAYNNYANALKELGRDSDALTNYKISISLNPHDSETYFNLANVFSRKENYNLAIENYQKAIQLNPNSFEGFNNLGLIYEKIGQYENAYNSFLKAVEINGNYAAAYFNLGNLSYNKLLLNEKAALFYEKSIDVDPQFIHSYYRLGIVLSALKKYDEAIVNYEKAITLEENARYLWGNLLFAKMSICSWSKSSDILTAITNKLSLNLVPSQPFPLLSTIDSNEIVKKSTEVFSKNVTSKIQSSYPSRQHKKNKIKIAYFSSDLNNHAVGLAIVKLLELHDHSIFEICGFSFSQNNNDDISIRIMSTFDDFYDISEMTDENVAQLCHTLDLDIAINLNGFTSGHRTNIFSFRLAPIQINYLGYPGSLMAPYFDYIIADPIIIPQENFQFFSEKIVTLPNSYHPYDTDRVISDRKFTRAELGLPENAFVFCAFNQNYKINPNIFDSWMRILKKVNNSILWLFEDNQWASENLKKEAMSRDINPNRLVFLQRLPLISDHLARHQYGDLFLDCYPYNAHSTGLDALYSGLPVLTLKGSTFPSRVGASFLSTIGLPELITSNIDDYEKLAIELGNNPNYIKLIKEKLNNLKIHSPLFDMNTYTKNFENSLQLIYENYQKNIKINHLTV